MVDSQCENSVTACKIANTVAKSGAKANAASKIAESLVAITIYKQTSKAEPGSCATKMVKSYTE